MSQRVGEPGHALRVALLAGTLGRGGAEKQLVYMARALQQAGAAVRVYTLGAGEFYEAALRDARLSPIGVGQLAHPALRLAAFVRALRSFRPHIIQAGHFYVNLYPALAARLLGAIGLGAIRGDVVLELEDTGRWGRLLLRAPSALVANSHAGRRTATLLGVSGTKIHVVPNVIEASVFGRTRASRRPADEAVVALIGTLVRAKRVDRFLEALALARHSTPGLTGVVVGDGPERAALESQAGRLGLLPDGVEFRGASDDIPQLMAEVDALVLTSDHEGFPNVILEAMSARLPVVTTPAGDAGVVVEDGVSGFVVPFDAVEALADRLVRLARSPVLRHEFGEAGHDRVIRRYAPTGLADRLFAVYRAVARQRGLLSVLGRLPLEADGAAATASS